jgi:ribose-phosphate pyrophosphokinase
VTWEGVPERFSDGEFNFQIDENVRGGDVFLVQPTARRPMRT